MYYVISLLTCLILGGSIRVPSAFNFLYGIKPSHGRMPYGYMANSMEGQETIHSAVGPIGHSASGIVQCTTYYIYITAKTMARSETSPYVRFGPTTMEV